MFISERSGSKGPLLQYNAFLPVIVTKEQILIIDEGIPAAG